MSIEWVLVAIFTVMGLVLHVVTLGNVLALKRMVRDRLNQPLDMGGTNAAESSTEKSGIVFCRACGNAHDSLDRVCPSCQTLRG